MLAAPAAKREAKVGETGRTLKAEPRRASSFDPAPAGNQAMLRMFAAQRGLQAKPAIDRPVSSALVMASLEICVDCAIWRLISATEDDSSSVAAATVPTLVDASFAASPTNVEVRLE